MNYPGKLIHRGDGIHRGNEFPGEIIPRGNEFTGEMNSPVKWEFPGEMRMSQYD